MPINPEMEAEFRAACERRISERESETTERGSLEEQEYEEKRLSYGGSERTGEPEKTANSALGEFKGEGAYPAMENPQFKLTLPEGLHRLNIKCKRHDLNREDALVMCLYKGHQKRMLEAPPLEVINNPSWILTPTPTTFQNTRI